MKRFDLLFLIIQVPVDMVFLLFAGVTAYALRFTPWAVSLKPVLFTLTLEQFLWYVVLLVPIVCLIFAFSGLYGPVARRRFAQDVIRVCIAMLAALSVLALYFLFSQTLFDSRFLIITTWGLAIVYVLFGRFAVRVFQGLLYRLGFGLKRVLFVGKGAAAVKLKETLMARPELGFKVVRAVDVFSRKHVGQQKIDEIMLADPKANSRSALAALAYASEHHIGFRYSADLFATLSSNMEVHPLAGVPMVEIKRTRLDGWGSIAKRGIDILGSLTLILLTSPIMLISTLMILVETGRPVIYRNKRVGTKRTHFFTLKFRSMYQKDSTGEQFGKSGKEALEREAILIQKQNSKKGPIYKVANDPRVTPVGRFLRRWSIDEIPQFVNVLMGDMSLVGPRPHQPREVEGYGKDHELVFHIKPGITGLAQISGRSDLPYEEEMRLDVLYLERWSLWLDFIILLKTPFIIFKKRKVV